MVPICTRPNLPTPGWIIVKFDHAQLWHQATAYK